MNLHPGKFQFVYNIGNADVRMFDIFDSGQIQMRTSRTNEITRVSSDCALHYLDMMIDLAEQDKERFKTTPMQDKITKTKLDILRLTRRFIEENYISEDDIRYFS